MCPSQSGHIFLNIPISLFDEKDREKFLALARELVAESRYACWARYSMPMPLRPAGACHVWRACYPRRVLRSHVTQRGVY